MWRFPVTGLTDGSVTASLSTAADNIEDTAGNDLVATSNTSWNFTVVATLAAPNLVDASDSGTHDDDDITNVTVPTFDGIAPAGSLVKLMINGAEKGMQQLAPGQTDYEITSTLLVAGNRSAAIQINDVVSSSLPFEIDTTGPRVKTVTVSNSNNGHDPYAIPDKDDTPNPDTAGDGDQLASIQVGGGINTFEVEFDEVVEVQTNALRVRDAAGTGSLIFPTGVTPDGD